MTKVSFKNLGLKVDQAVKVITFNEQEIEVKQYLLVNNKLELISRVINKADASDENNFVNPVKIDMFFALEVIYNYTNLNITDKQKEDELKLYDVVVSSGLYSAVMDAIPANELSALYGGLREIVENIYKYRNSALGILEIVSQDYSNLNLDASEIQRKLADPQNMELLKSVLTKLG